MRIAYLCSDPGVPLGGRKGASVHVAGMVRAFASLGHEVLVVAHRGDRGALEDAPGGGSVDVHVPGADPIDRELERGLREEPDAGEAVAWTVAAIAGAAGFRHRARTLVKAFGPDLVYERYALFGATGAVVAAELGVPLVLEVNAPLSDEQAAHRGLAFPATARAVEMSILTAAHSVVAVSGAVAAWLRERGVDPGRIAVLANGVDPERFTPRPDPGARARTRQRFGLDGGPVVGFVGTLKPWHDLAAAFDAVARLRAADPGCNVQVLVVGDGPGRADLERRAADPDLVGAVTLTGAVNHDEVPALLAAMDVAVAPYAGDMPFYFSPLKVFESFAAGLPVVAPVLGDLAHCLGPAAAATGGRTGWTYEAGDVGGLTAALGAAVADPAEAMRRGARGREHVLACHTWRATAERVVDLAMGA